MKQARETGWVKVRQVRRRKAALPQAVEWTVEAEAAEQPREAEEDAPAAGKDENEVASGREVLETGCGGVSWRRKMLEDVVKTNDIEDSLVGKVLRKEAGDDRESVLPRLSCDSRIGFQADSGIAAAGGSVQKPPMRTADVEEPGSQRNR